MTLSRRGAVRRGARLADRRGATYTGRSMTHGDLVFTGLVYRDGSRFTAICPELDVATDAATRAAARERLLEAVTLYLETCFQENLPYLRPVPPDTFATVEILDRFRIAVDLTVAAHA